MLSKRSSHDMLMTASPDRFNLLTDINGFETSSGGLAKRRRIVTSAMVAQQRGEHVSDENAFHRMTGSKRILHDVFGTSGGCSGQPLPFTPLTKRIRARTAADDAKDVPKYTERQVEFLKHAHAQELDQVQQEQQALKAEIECMRPQDVLTENAILKKAVRCQDGKAKQTEVEMETMRVIVAQMRDHIAKLEQECYHLRAQVQNQHDEPYYHTQASLHLGY